MGKRFLCQEATVLKFHRFNGSSRFSIFVTEEEEKVRITGTAQNHLVVLSHPCRELESHGVEDHKLHVTAPCDFVYPCSREGSRTSNREMLQRELLDTNIHVSWVYVLSSCSVAPHPFPWSQQSKIENSNFGKYTFAYFSGVHFSASCKQAQHRLLALRNSHRCCLVWSPQNRCCAQPLLIHAVSAQLFRLCFFLFGHCQGHTRKTGDDRIGRNMQLKLDT